MRQIIHESIIKCPHCGFEKMELMPEHACVHFYECSNCHVILKPKEGSCCVFCSYGTAKCPPQQSEQKEEDQS